ncbi:RAVE protein 1 C terminal-domain-containing protein [Umbelopsis sp. PMI_123]|nr:RAVE protein 1 C terminal-domain-containing protein [Umbelopsis sp. PMI_123]
MLKESGNIEGDTNMGSVSSVVFNNTNGKLVVSYETCALVLCIRDDNGRSTWSLESLLKDQENGAMIYCVDWGSRGELLIAGEQLGIWELDEQGDWVRTWNQRPATPIIKAQFSPNCSMFATLSKWDGLVTVWYESKEEGSLHRQYSFSYLSHASDTTNIDWRYPPHNSRHSEHDPAIFTMCKDGIGRFWSSMDIDAPHNLYMTAVIDPNQSLVTATGDEDFDYTSEGTDATFFPIHYMNSAELDDAVQLCTVDQGGQLGSKVRRIRDMIKDTPDMLFKVQKDGSLTIWGIQHLNEWPRRIPKVFVVLRVAQAIPSKEAIHFMSNVKIYHNHLGSKTSSSVNPVELFILTQGIKGQLSCYTINLIDFFDSTRFASQLYLRYSWLGHQSQIVDIQRYQHSNYFLTRSKDDNFAIWKYERPKFGTRIMYGLREKDFHVSVGKSTSVAIIRDDTYLAVSQGARVYIYKRNSSKLRYEIYTDCPMPIDGCLVDGLHCFEIPGSEPDDPKQYVLVGTSSGSQKLFSWRLQFVDQSIQVQVLGIDSLESGWTNFVSATSYAGLKISLNAQLSFGNRFYFVTCQGSSMFFWTLKKSLDDIELDGDTSGVWLSHGPLDCHSENIKQISAMSNNAVAVVSALENGSTRLSIWSEIRTGHLPQHEADLDLSDNVNGLSWCRTSDSQALLAVAVGQKVQIYTRKRIKDIQDDKSWALCDEMKLDSNVTAIAWAEPGVLVAASGQTLTTYSKWLTMEDKASEPLPTIFDITFKMNGPLPLFHPDVLVHYFLWGKLDLINYVFKILYRYLHAAEHTEARFISAIPPTILDKVFSLQKESIKKKQGKQQYDFLWSDDNEKDSLNDIDDLEQPLTEKEANYLKDRLNEKSMVFMTKIDRLHLIAQVDTLVHVLNRRESVDENGARYMIFLKNFYFLNSIVDADKKQDVLSYRDMIWARHSQSQDAILEFADTFIEKMTWKDARALGIFLWLDKADTMRQRMEAIARNTYLSQDDKDPVSSTLYYLALGKKSLVHTLWRSASHHKEQKAMLKFLANDFRETRWQTAASKNAFALLGKQRYEYAAAFFLLAGKLRDAINVILKHMKDIQLAVAICRVYEGDHGPVLREIITEHMLPSASRTDDRWLASLAFWMIDKTDEAVAVTMIPPQKLIDPDGKSQFTHSPSHLDPSLLILYQYLKEKTSQSRKKNYQITYDLEYEFLLNATRTYERYGCPLLSLYILTQYKISPPLVPERQSSFMAGNSLKSMDDANDPVTTGALEFEGWDSKNNEQEANQGQTKAARAADLFNDDDDDSFDHPFASGGTQSRAVDLFADEPAKLDRAQDLFGDNEDIFASNTSTAKDIFADYLPAKDLEPTSAGTSSPVAPKEEEKPTVNLLDDENLYVYKASLVMQMLQFILHAAAVLSGDNELSNALSEEPFFKKYILKMRSEFLDLANSVKINESDFRNLLILKSVETDAFGLVLRVLDKDILESDDAVRFMNVLEGGSNERLWLAFNHQDLTLSGILYVEKWARDSLSTYPVWGNVTSTIVPSVDSKKIKILLAGYTAILVTALRRQYYEQAWGFLSEMKMLLCYICKDKNEIPNVIQKCLSGDIKLIDMEPEDYEYFSDDSFRVYDLDEDQFKFDAQPSTTLASTLLELASLQLSVHLLESALGNTDSQFSGQYFMVVDYGKSN